MEMKLNYKYMVVYLINRVGVGTCLTTPYNVLLVVR